MINRTVQVGRPTTKPELKQTKAGKYVTSFSLAVGRTFTNRNGVKEADFIPVVIWDKQAENVVKYVEKGHLIGVEGRLQTRSYDDSTGAKRFVMEVVADSVQFLESRNNQQSQQQQNQTQVQSSGTANMQNDIMFDFNTDNTFDVTDDDLPF